MSLKAIIFDLDGTLVDSNELHVESWEQAFRHFGKRFSKEELRKQIGKGSDQYLPEFLTKAEIDRFGEELDEYRSVLFLKEFLPRVPAFPKVRELFEKARASDLQIALATSGKKSETKTYKKLTGISDLIDVETTADDADKSKPAPDIFEAAFQKLKNVKRDEAIVIGDTRFDMEAARKAGLAAVGVTCGGTDAEKLRTAGAREIFRDPADLLARFDELMAS